jgi:hypothetical protein
MARAVLTSLIDGGIDRKQDLMTQTYTLTQTSGDQTSIIAGSYGNYVIGENNTTPILTFSVQVRIGSDYDVYLLGLVNNRLQYAQAQERRIFIEGFAMSTSLNVVTTKTPDINLSNDAVSNPDTAFRTFFFACTLVSGILPN